MFIRLAAAALSTPLGATNIVTLEDTTSSGLRSRTAGVIASNNGSFYSYINNSPVVVFNWITPQNNVSQYEIRATLTGDALTSGTLDTWEALSSSRSWTLATSTESESLSSSLLLEIRWTGNNVVQDSATITLNATGPQPGDTGGGPGNNNPGGETEID